ncbi:ABC transporter permease [Fredinandcohnia humi]
MGTIFKTMIVTSLRDKITLFYSILFPVLILIGLGYYVDNEDYIPRLLTGVIVLSSLFWGVSGIAFQVFGQRTRGVYKLLKVTPLPTMHFILLMAAARTILGIGINLLVLFVGIVLFDIAISPNELLGAISVMFIGILCFTCLGFFISNFANNEGQINMISNLFFLPMIFGTDTFYSLENAPTWVARMGDFFPLGYYTKALRIVIGIEESEQTTMALIIILLGFTLLLLILATVTFKWEAQSQVDLKKGSKGKEGLSS